MPTIDRCWRWPRCHEGCVSLSSRLQPVKCTVNTMATQVGNWKGAGGWYENLFLVTLFLTSMPLASSLLLETWSLRLFAKIQTFQSKVQKALDNGSEIPEWRFENRDSRFEIRGSRFENRNSRIEIQDPRSEIRGSRSEIRDPRIDTPLFNYAVYRICFLCLINP